MKEIWGAGQQQVRNVWSNIGCWHLNQWLHTLEFDCHPNVGREAVVGSLLPVHNGRVPVPQTAGLGAVPDIEALERYRTWSGKTV